MADRSRRRALVLTPAAAFLLVTAVPSAAFATAGRDQPAMHITIADAPPGAGEDCVDDPDAHPGVGLQRCPTPFSVLSLLPFVAGGVLIVVAIVAGWFLVMRRRASRPFPPDDAFEAGATAGAGAVGAASGGSSSGRASGDWWTCRNCGATNMVGSARCYKCGAWPR